MRKIDINPLKTGKYSKMYCFFKKIRQFVWSIKKIALHLHPKSRRKVTK